VVALRREALRGEAMAKRTLTVLCGVLLACSDSDIALLEEIQQQGPARRCCLADAEREFFSNEDNREARDAYREARAKIDSALEALAEKNQIRNTRTIQEIQKGFDEWMNIRAPYEDVLERYRALPDWGRPCTLLYDAELERLSLEATKRGIEEERIRAAVSLGELPIAGE